MSDVHTLSQQLNNWLEVSRAAVDDQLLSEHNDLTLSMQRTETLLAVSRSLRTISKQNREYAEKARHAARAIVDFGR